MADFLTNLLLPPNQDKSYAEGRLKKHGYGSGNIQRGGELDFTLREGQESDRQAALSGMSGTMGQLIKLMTYLKGIGAFKSSAFKSTQPQDSSQMGVLGGMNKYQNYGTNPDPMGVEPQMQNDQGMNQYLNALMGLNQRGV
jgi:hypothetical protein